VSRLRVPGPAGGGGRPAPAARSLARSLAHRPRAPAPTSAAAPPSLTNAGNLPTRGAYADVGADISAPLPHGESRTAGTEAIALRVRGDGHTYACIVSTAEGQRYAARFPTRNGYLTVRLPFTTFRPEFPDHPPLNPGAIKRISIRYEHRRSTASAPAPPPGAMMPAAGAPPPPPINASRIPTRAGASASASAARMGGAQARPGGGGPPPGRPGGPPPLSAQKFNLEVDWIKALPSGAEPDFVLVSCAGSGRTDLAPGDLEKVVGYKRRGEEALRASGLGYSVIRPGALVEEPGGYKALVFDQARAPAAAAARILPSPSPPRPSVAPHPPAVADPGPPPRLSPPANPLKPSSFKTTPPQGSRITESISYADVADICLRALREREAHNKTFDVAYEYQPEDGLQTYELVAQLAGKDTNYLAPALATLQKNT